MWHEPFDKSKSKGDHVSLFVQFRVQADSKRTHRHVGQISWLLTSGTVLDRKGDIRRNGEVEVMDDVNGFSKLQYNGILRAKKIPRPPASGGTATWGLESGA